MSYRIERKALGRIEEIGAEYNAHLEQFCGSSIFCETLPDNLVKTTPNPNTCFEMVTSDSIQEKMRKLNVEAELKLSFLCDLVKVGGHGKFLKEKKSNDLEVSVSLICQMTMKKESINMNNKQIIELISKSTLNGNSDITHFVTAIDYGVTAIATLTSKCSDWKSKQALSGKLNACLEKVETVLKGGASGQVDVDALDDVRKSDMSLKFVMDGLPDGGNFPNNAAEAVDFLKKIPSIIRNTNGGNGVPISYTLTPISCIQAVGLNATIDNILHSIDEDAIYRITEVMDDLMSSARKLEDVKQTCIANSPYLRGEFIESIREKCNEVNTEEARLRKKIKETMVKIRRGEIEESTQLFEIANSFKTGPVSSGVLNIFLQSKASTFMKIDYITRLVEVGVRYAGKGDFLDSVMRQFNQKSYMIFFCNFENMENLEDNRAMFESHAMDQDPEVVYIFVDLEANPELHEDRINRISLFEKGKCVVVDLLSEDRKDLTSCFIKPKNCSFTFSQNVPKTAVELEIRCPNSVCGGRCNQHERTWTCYKCRDIIFYDPVPRQIHCKCGKLPLTATTFRCSDEYHGFEFVSFDLKVLREILEERHGNKPRKNILVLGEVGVGKTTFIKRFVNNINHAEDFRSGPPTAEHYANDGVPGEATLFPSTEICAVGFTKVCFIDTPGIGRGRAQDLINLHNILEYISSFEELHGICILLKYEIVFSDEFTYFMMQLFCRLHSSVVGNILFCYTQSMSSADCQLLMQNLLQTMLDTIAPNRFHLTEEKIYFVNNDSLRLSDSSEGDEHANYPKSWLNSSKEIARLLNYVNGIEAHCVKKSDFLRKCRHWGLSLIPYMFYMNIRLTELRKEDCEDTVQKVDEEYKFVQSSCAGFALFVELNAVCSCKDFMIKSLKLTINEENHTHFFWNFEIPVRIDGRHMEKLLSDYKSAKKERRERMKTEGPITFNQVRTMEIDLRKLEWSADRIRKILDSPKMEETFLQDYLF